MFGRDEPVLSFEFFPPKTDKGLANLERTISDLKPLGPSFVSVTYGAGGSTREKTVDLVSKIRNEMGIESMAHLTCVDQTQEELAAVLDRLGTAGVENVLALRGDPPEGKETFERPEGGFGFANELTAFIKERYSFCLGGAFYPEGHVECEDREVDLANLKRKAASGSDFLVSQLFFDNIDYFEFVKRARGVGIDAPMVPGIMPISNVSQVKRFTQMCGARIPVALLKKLEGVAHDPEAVARVGIEHATGQCRGLIEGGAPGIHFYTLNKSPATRRIFENLKSLGVV